MSVRSFYQWLSFFLFCKFVLLVLLYMAYYKHVVLFKKVNLDIMLNFLIFHIFLYSWGHFRCWLESEAKQNYGFGLLHNYSRDKGSC